VLPTAMYDPRMASKEDEKGQKGTVAAISSSSPELAQAALDKLRPRLAALRPEEVLPVNVDIPTAASIALGAHERMLELRPAIVEHLHSHAVELLDELPTYALAAWYAHLISLPAADNGDRARKLMEEAVPLRESLLVAAEALAHRGLLDPGRVADIRAGQGNIDRASDLVGLADLFLQAWPQIAQKTAVDRAEVERAAALGPELLAALGSRGLAEKQRSSPETRDLRARAFTLLLNAYEECARAVTYLRWHEDDAEAFAPTLRPRSRAPRAAAPTETNGESAATKPPSGVPASQQ
jgi:hypothetical protein